MTTTSWWALVGAALVLGLAAGGWIAFRFARVRFDRQLRRATDEVHQRHAATIDQQRAALVRAQTELDQSKNSFKRQLTAMAAEPKAALERTEERLKAAYAELDRLRAKVIGDTGPAELGDGFAATRPMRDGL